MDTTQLLIELHKFNAAILGGEVDSNLLVDKLRDAEQLRSKRDGLSSKEQREAVEQTERSILRRLRDREGMAGLSNGSLKKATKLIGPISLVHLVGSMYLVPPRDGEGGIRKDAYLTHSALLGEGARRGLGRR